MSLAIASIRSRSSVTKNVSVSKFMICKTLENKIALSSIDKTLAPSHRLVPATVTLIRALRTVREVKSAVLDGKGQR